MIFAYPEQRKKVDYKLKTNQENIKQQKVIPVTKDFIINFKLQLTG
jgi:hypothetical protein